MRTEAELGPLDDLADDARPTRRRRCSHAESDPSSSLLCRLPHDLAARVLATLPPSARARCAAVSRGWRDLLRDLPPQQLWHELDFTRDDREVRADAARLRYRVSRRFFGATPTRISSTRADAPFPPQLTRESFVGATRRARGALRVLKVPGDAGITRGAIVTAMRANRESLRVVEALSSEDSREEDFSDDAATPATGFWTPKQVHEAVNSSGPKLLTFAVDVRARGACGALMQQLTSPVVRVRRLDVRAGVSALAAEDKKRLFAAVAVAASPASRDGSFSRSGGLRRLTLASCGLSAEDAEELVAALGGDDAELAPERDKKTDDETNAPGGGFELDVAENPGLGCAGAAALAKLVADGKIRALRMETCGVGEAGARALGDALASRRCALTALDLSRNFLGAGGAAALAEGLAFGAAAGAARLATLRLGHNAFGCAGASALAACAKTSDALERLERLDLQSNGMGPEGIAFLARGVLSARGAPRLRELRLQGNPMGAAGARALARASLALPDGDEGEALSPAFATHGSLRVLGLGSAKLGVVGAAAVAWAMRQELSGALRGVSALDLSANDVGESGAALPVSGRDVVRGGFSHDRADVEAGTLGDAGGRTATEDEDEDEDEDENDSNALASLARDLAAAPALRRLDLGYNSLGDAGARVVAAAVASRRAPDARGAFALDLRRNSIGDAGAAALARALSAAAAAGDAGDVLSSVDLRSNAIGEEGLEALRAHVAAGRVASNYMPTRWARQEPAPTEQEAPETRGLGGREEGAAEVEVAA
jgi:hypothetical protein